MTDRQMLGNSFCEFGLVSSKDLVPLFDPKVHLFENSSLKIMAKLHWAPMRNEHLGMGKGHCHLPCINV